jgi:hypothetical protein
MSDFNWRSSQTYDRTQTLEPAGFAWECLRRNHDYRGDHRKLSHSKSDPAMMTAFREKWGLSFRR